MLPDDINKRAAFKVKYRRAYIRTHARPPRPYTVIQQQPNNNNGRTRPSVDSLDYHLAPERCYYYYYDDDDDDALRH